MQPITGLTRRQTTTLPHGHSHFRQIDSPNKHVFGLEEEPGVPGETCKRRTERPVPKFEPQTFLL